MPQTSETKVEYPFAGITLPERNSHKDSFFHSIDNVENWIETLPIASPIECAKLVFQSLFEMNRTEMDPNQRIRALETLSETIESVSSSLKARFTSSVSFPLLEKNHKISLLTREICKEMAIGYKTAVADQIKSGHVKSHQQPHIIAIHRVIYYLTRVLHFSYLVYEAYPARTWHELHLIFTYSSINKFDRVPVEDVTGEQEQNFTIKHLYIKALLLAAASPFQLRQREMEVLFQQLDQFLLLAKLTVNNGQEDLAFGFMINLHADKPPAHVSSGQKPNKQFFLMDTRPILEVIQHSLTNLASGPDKLPDLSTHLKLLLLKNWGHSPQRHFVRTQLNFDLEIAVGLNQIHELISSAKESTAKKSLYLGPSDSVRSSNDTLRRSSLFLTEEEDQTNSVLSLKNYNEGPANEGTFLSTQKIERDMQIKGDELLNPQKADTGEKTHSCKTVNESSGGYCIDWPIDASMKIRVGELIGIQSSSQAVDFGLAITRWIKCLSDFRILVGIEIISHNSQSTKVRVDKIVPKHKDITFHPALSMDKRAEDTRFLVTPSDMFNEGENLISKDEAGNEEHLKLTSLVESTGLFSQYKVTHVTPVKSRETE